jgi:hypothetical protein
MRLAARESDRDAEQISAAPCDPISAGRCYPRTFAAIAGGDSNLKDVIKRLRCSKCGERKCEAKVTRSVK